MKKSPVFSALLIFSLLSFPAIFSSCSSSDQETDSSEETATLRYTADALYEATIWTEEIEVDRLSTKVNSVNGISSKLNLTPLIVLASVPSESSRIYPRLGSFGSLDTSLISKTLRETLVSFSDSIAKYKDADSFMSKECLYSLSLFYADFKRIFNDCFELDKIETAVAEQPDSEKKAEDISEKSEEIKKEEPGKEDLKGEEETKVETIKEKSYFGSFKIGQPFLDGIYYQVPLKFFSDKANLTLCVFCFEEAGVWKIDQVQITDWEIF